MHKLLLTTLRLPADWQRRLRRKKRKRESVSDYVRQLIRPILTGELVAERGKDGSVVGFKAGDPGRVQRLSGSPRPGRPKERNGD